MTPSSRPRLSVRLGLLCAVLLLTWPASGMQAAPRAAGGDYQLFLPMVLPGSACEPLPAQSYAILSVDPPGPSMPVDEHPDHNLAVRGYEASDGYCGLVEYAGATDPGSPQFVGLFAEPRLPRFARTYQVYDWDWERMARGALISHPAVTALGLETRPGETLHVPDSGYTIGSGCEVLVIYAASDRITLKYTREDNVVYGYTLHIDRICVDPTLVTLYQACHHAGRAFLPALRPGQAFGRARGEEMVIAIVDTGTFLDARSRADWWRDY